MLTAPVTISDGAKLWTARSAGSTGGRPGMVFVHGGPGMWDYLGPVAAMAEHSFRTLRYDQRGCGRSSESDDHRLTRHVADLDELRQHAGYDRWYVFGHSFGATLALEYAVAHPGRVAGLVYCSGLGIGWSTHREMYEAAKRRRLTGVQTRRRVELEERERSWAEEVEWRTLSWLPDFADPVTAPSLALADASTPLRLNLACNRALNAETTSWSEAEERARWSPVTAPVWLVHGEADPRPVDGSAALAEILTGGSLRVLPGAGHQPWRERPDLVRAVLDDLAAHDRDSRAPG